MVATRSGRGTGSDPTTRAKHTCGAQPYNLRSKAIAKRKSNQNLERKKKTARVRTVKREVPTLPPEVWRQVLTFLRDSEKLLLQLRLVSWQWRALADEILTENSAPFLNSWRSHQHTGDELWLKNRNFVTSRFNYWWQLGHALDFPPEADSTGSPFPTGVVILCPYIGWRKNDILERNRLIKFNFLVPCFLSRFGKWISTLVYFFHPEDTGSQPISHFRDSILQIPNLRNLFMYSEEWELDPYQLLLPPALEEAESPTLSTSLRQVQLGRERYESYISYRLPPILLFVQFSSVLESLTSLEFEWPYQPYNDVVPMLGTDPRPLLHCPKLQRLKIGNPTSEILHCFCKPEPDSTPRLKELSLIINNQADEKTFHLFQELIPLLDIHARWLTSFTLEFVYGSTWRELRKHFGEGETNFFADTGVQFPHLKKVGIHVNSVQDVKWWPDLQTLFQKFPNLEEISASGYNSSWTMSLDDMEEDWEGPRNALLRVQDWQRSHLKLFLEQVVPPTLPGIRMFGHVERFAVRGEEEAGNNPNYWSEVCHLEGHCETTPVSNLNGELFGEEDGDGTNLFQDSGVKFPHLKELSLHLHMMLGRWWPDVRVLFRKFPNVEKVLVLGVYRPLDYVAPEEYNGGGLLNYCAKAFLKQVAPPTVAGIRIRMPDSEDRFQARE